MNMRTKQKQFKTHNVSADTSFQPLKSSKCVINSSSNDDNDDSDDDDDDGDDETLP